MELASQLVGAAQEYRRWRSRAIAMGVLLAIAAGAAGWLVSHGRRPPAGASHAGSARAQPSSSVLASDSVWLVGDGSSEGIHVTVMLKRQAAKVTASVDGRAAELHPFKSTAHPGTGFSGVLQTPLTSPPLAGVPGAHGGSVTVHLRIAYIDGSLVGTAFAAHFQHGLALP